MILTATMTNKYLTSSTSSIPANKLVYAQITGNFHIASLSDVQITRLTTSVNIPSRRNLIKKTVYAEAVHISLAEKLYVSIWQGTVGCGT